MYMRLVAVGILAFITINNVKAEVPIRLRVLTYNIHHAEGVDGKLDVQRIAGVIREASPDLIALQEVDQNVSRTNSVDQPRELASLLGMNFVFGGNIELQGGRYGNAILSRFPITGHVNRLLPNYDGGEQRGVLTANIQVPSMTSPILFLDTHFDHRRSDQERIASAKFVNEIVLGEPEALAILAGDMNDTPMSPTVEILSQQWKQANTSPLATIPVDQPKQQIDYILIRPQKAWKVVEARVLDEAIASDHRALLVILEIGRD